MAGWNKFMFWEYYSLLLQCMHIQLLKQDAKDPVVFFENSKVLNK